MLNSQHYRWVREADLQMKFDWKWLFLHIYIFFNPLKVTIMQLTTWCNSWNFSRTKPNRFSDMFFRCLKFYQRKKYPFPKDNLCLIYLCFTRGNTSVIMIVKMFAKIYVTDFFIRDLEGCKFHKELKDIQGSRAKK